MPDFTFDPIKHEYRLDGRVLPSVTQILKPLRDFSHVDPVKLERAAKFGDAVHLATALDDRDDLDESSCHPDVLGCVNGWRKFKSETGFEVEHVELALCSSTLYYAGTLDRVGIMKRYNDNVQGKRVLIDIKTGSWLYATIGLQTAAYRSLWNEHHPDSKIVPRFSVRLFMDGTYKLDAWDDPMDSKTFMALLQVHNWSVKHALDTKSAVLLEWADSMIGGEK